MTTAEDRKFWQWLWQDADAVLDDRQRRHIDNLLLDTIAIAMHARTKGVGAAAIDATALAPMRPGKATVWGGTESLVHPLDAALLNGTAAEALDFQEVLIDGRNNGHAAVVVAPALIALAQARGVSSARLRQGMRLALAANLALLRALGRGHRAGRVGFRTTSLGAPVAAAFAGAYILDTSIETAINAAAIAAAALPAGLLAAMDPEVSSFSTDKDTAVGLSAHHAVHSVLLAENGATGPAAALTGARGWLASFGFDTSNPAYLDAPEVDEALWCYQIKRFPVNFGAQAAVRAALTLASDLSPDTIRAVTVRVKQSSATSLRTRSLSTHAAARFSLAYAVASALVRKRSVLADFDPSALSNPDVLALMDLCTIEPDSEMEAEHQERGVFPADVMVTTRDGARRSQVFEGPWDGLDSAERARALNDKWAALVGDETARFLRARLEEDDSRPLLLHAKALSDRR